MLSTFKLYFVTLQSNLIFIELVPAFFQEDDDIEDMVESPDKRNSELLNSLLALPGGIHRSGKYVLSCVPMNMSAPFNTLGGTYKNNM